jgi:hypothetical protein
VEEKNPTVVNFPLKGVDFRDCQFMTLVPSRTQEKHSLPPTDLSSAEQHPPPVYDLIANVIHESVAGTTRDKENTVWKVQLRAGSGENEKWFQIQDLIVEEIRKEMIFLGETVIQVPFSPHNHPAIADHCLLDLGTPKAHSRELRGMALCRPCSSSMHPISRFITRVYSGIGVYDVYS